MSRGTCALGPRRGLPPPARLFLCNAVVMLGESGSKRQVELWNWWVVLGVGQAIAPTLIAVLAANSLTQNLATWEENGSVFPSSALLFWVLFFLVFIFKPTIFPRVQVTVCVAGGPRGGQPWLWQVSGSLPRGPASGPRTPSARAWLPLPARPPLCPGLVCEVGMTIAATFQPTSQGCCGDTVISEIVHVVMRREPPAFLKTEGTLLPPDPKRFSPPLPLSLCPSAAPASLLPALVSLSLSSGASLTSAESPEHLTRQLQTHPSSLSSPKARERGFLAPARHRPLVSRPHSPPRSDQFLSLPSPQAQ